MTPQQFRAARALIGCSQDELAARAEMSIPTLKRLESGKGPKVADDMRARLVSALQSAGVIFINENGEGPGVRLRKLPAAG